MVKQFYKTIRIPLSNHICIDDLEYQTSVSEVDLPHDRYLLENLLADEEEYTSYDVQLEIFNMSQMQSLILAFKSMGYNSQEIITLLHLKKKKFYTEYGHLRNKVKKDKKL
jgi:hypothetical protein